MTEPDDGGAADRTPAPTDSESVVPEAFTSEAAVPGPADTDAADTDTVDADSPAPEPESAGSEPVDGDSAMPGDPALATVDSALARLDGIDDTALAEHADRYETVHGALQDVLADTDPGAGRE